MNAFKKATKRITAVAASAAMVSSAVFGAGLGDYPGNFVSGGKFNADVVVGSTADAMDSSSANSIISNLESRYSSEGGMVAITYRASGSGKSVAVADSNDDLNLRENLSSSVDEFTDSDFPSFLADGTVIDNDYEDDEYDYEQTITLGNARVDFGRNVGDLDDLTDVPVLFLDLTQGTYLYQLTVDFKDTLIIADTVADESDEGLSNSETITLFGKTFTFDPSNKQDDTEMTLFASSNIVTAVQGQKVSVESDGQTYDVEVLGANSDSDEVTLEVNGISKSVNEGTNTKVGGLDVYVDEVFISNVGGDSAAVRLFLGSDEVVIPSGAIGTGNWVDVEVDGEPLNGYEVNVLRTNAANTSADWSDVETISFRFTPQDLDDEAETEFLQVGESVVDPLFGTLAVEFTGASEDFDAGDYVELKRSSDDLELTFTNRDGDEYTVNLYTGTAGATVANHADIFSLDSTENLTNISEDKIFFLEEDVGAADLVSKAYEVVSITTSGSDKIVRIRDLSDDSTTDYEAGDEIGSSGVFVQNVYPVTGNEEFSLATTTTPMLANLSNAASVVDTIYTMGDVKVDLGDLSTPAATTTVVFTEDQDSNIDEAEITADVITVTVGTGATASDEDITLAAAGALVSPSDEDNNVEYGLTEMGSYYELEKDNNGDYFKLWTPQEELDYFVNFVAGEVGQTNVKTVAASDAAAEEQALVDAGFEVVDVKDIASEDVDFAVSAPVMDSDVTGTSDLIVVGGPAVNTVAADLLGLSFPAFGAASGLSAGEAMVKYFESENSVLVYGWSKEDTAAAASALNAGGLSGSEYNVQ